MDVAVIGVGRMGSHHARTYANNIDSANLVAVVDGDQQRAQQAAEKYGCRALESVDDLLKAFPSLNAATVAVPTKYHLPAARPLLEKSIACLIEKPIAPSAAQARELVQLAADNSATLQVGHTERFNPAVRAVAAMNLKPQFMEIDRVSPMTFRSLDVGVVMDMMIHDLDIVLAFMNSTVEKVDASGVAVLSEHADIANARLTFKQRRGETSGAVANITASRLALKTERKMRLFSPLAYVSMDYQKRSGLVIRLSENTDALKQVRQQIQEGADLSDVDYAQLVNMEQLTMDLPEDQDPLTAELISFLNAVSSGTKPEVDGAAGLGAVDVAEKIIAQIHGTRLSI